MSNWEQTHRRYDLVYAVADAIALRGPEVIDEWHDEIDEVFDDVAGFLRDVQRRWYTAVDAYLDAVLEEQPADVEAAVAEILGRVSTTDRALRIVLDAFADHPALAEGDAQHRWSLLAVTGVDQDKLVPPAQEQRQAACRVRAAARRALSEMRRVTESA